MYLNDLFSVLKPAECQPPCIENQGTCNSQGVCECVAGYTGDQCETSEFIIPAYDCPDTSYY